MVQKHKTSIAAKIFIKSPLSHQWMKKAFHKISDLKSQGFLE